MRVLVSLGRELLAVLAAVLAPTVPASDYLAAVVTRRRRRRLETDVAAGRAPETPFVVLASVGAALAAVAFVAVLVTLAARSLA